MENDEMTNNQGLSAEESPMGGQEPMEPTPMDDATNPMDGDMGMPDVPKEGMPDGDDNEEDGENGPVEERSSEDNAITLLKQVIKHLENDNKETAINYLKLAAKYLKGDNVEPINGIDPEEDGKIDENLLYGNNRNFGIIYKMFESNASQMLKTKKGKNVLKEAMNLIKSNPILNGEYRYYSMFLGEGNVSSPKEYVNEVCLSSPRFTLRESKKANQQLLDTIKKYQVDEMVEISDEMLNLYESIETTLFATKKGMSGLNEFISAKKVIEDYLKTRPVISESKKISFKDYENAVKKASEKISENLTNDEFKLIQETQESSQENENRFNYYKQEILHKLSKAMNEETDNERKAHLSKLYININEKKYNAKTALVDTAKLIEAKDILG